MDHWVKIVDKQQQYIWFQFNTVRLVVGTGVKNRQFLGSQINHHHYHHCNT